MSQEVNSLIIDKGTELLPIGTIVLLDIFSQPLMIYGRMQQQAEKNKIWQYVACPYPQGHISDETNVFFNHEQIKQVIFKGLESEGEKLMREKLNSFHLRDEK
ncbi:MULTISPECIES: DUF4176 domain-containing protein [Niallia]|jgi:hypothetical protein|uniref:Uncharacterized protein n=1 Tax=Niallia circulans TaxID=1397 RepID=A0A268FBL9_NIACI|nr:DUF4176 domain-containing protein [Niallia circulans]AYV69408.1 DUF4176 domain-containing protein [Niallia circulans]AYV72207.1 DUF4176 domain-containing protein [Niallia circulans]MCM2981619.1 DUF4176 domain-containing protein [Niallia circulans]PAD82768.1 hypothetical protein CHH57_13200 [Niallia circulans]UQZ74575.1 DUF4176 domain-containing protein [Niallia circulans]